MKQTTVQLSASAHIRGLELYLTGTAVGHDENVGIGPYECHGYCGTHNDYVFEVDEVIGGTISIAPIEAEEAVEFDVDEFRVKYPNIWSEFDCRLFDGQKTEHYDIYFP